MKDLWPGFQGSSPSFFAPLGTLAAFQASGPTGPSLWVADGTEEGTRVVSTSVQPQYLLGLGDRVVFN